MKRPARWPRPDTEAWGGAISLMHVPTGLFVQGHYQTADYNAPGHVASGYWGSAGGATKKDWSHWLIQAGVAKNWFGIGNTAMTYRAPAGVALAITPFNAPANLLAHKLGAAFAAGNTTRRSARL